MATRTLTWQASKALVLPFGISADDAEDAAVKVLTAEYVTWCRTHGVQIQDDLAPVILVARHPMYHSLGWWMAEGMKQIEVTDE